MAHDKSKPPAEQSIREDQERRLSHSFWLCREMCSGSVLPAMGWNPDAVADLATRITDALFDRHCVTLRLRLAMERAKAPVVAMAAKTDPT